MNIVELILNDLLNGSLKKLHQYREQLNDIAISILDPNKCDIDNYETTLGQIIRICHILYNNTDMEILPISDGLYDHLVELYKKYNPNYNVGADLINFKPTKIKNVIIFENENEPKDLIYFDKDIEEKNKNALFIDEILYTDLRVRESDLLLNRGVIDDNQYISKRTHDTPHNHPELVGTLDKAKFVLCKEAAERGVLTDPNVKILERDFFAEHIKRGIIDPNKEYTMCLELKYDGISVEADCTNIVESARSRGDTGVGKATDMTPILKGYKFTHMPENMSKSIGIKFEAIITRDDLDKFNKLRGYDYKNCRTAIVGLTGASDAYKYRDFITLVPLQVEDSLYHSDIINENRIAEIEFMNDLFVSHGCPMRYATIQGTYIELLFQIKMFLEECDFYRRYIPFMYDGIVVSYIDENVRKALGRENFINKYSMAVKFDPLKQLTIFREYKYTVGQDGSITPMIYYDPVEFYGTIHPKSSGHSYARFKELNLAVGDIISVEYVNDVMPYVYKPYNEMNDLNPNSPIEFPERCPICNSEVQISKSEKSVYCLNPSCGGRSLARMVNMFSKLNIAEFGESTVNKFNTYHIKDICEIYKNGRISEYGFGPGEVIQLEKELSILFNNPINDYFIIGSLGFTSVAEKTWKLIFSKFTLKEFISYIEISKSELILVDELLQIKGIGMSTVDTIIREYPYFRDDMIYCMENFNIIDTKYNTVSISSKQIRATGFRDKEFFNTLRSYGFDADDNSSVTKSTDILLVPYFGYNSGSKIKKVSEDCLIIPVEEFKNDFQKYL